MLNIVFTEEKIVWLLGVVFAFVMTMVCTVAARNYLPADQGRDFAVDGKLSRGKPRGAGIVFVLVFAVSAVLFAPVTKENLIYLVLVVMAMLTGFLDDAAKNPWGEYKKGLLDFLIAVLLVATYVYFNGTRIRLAVFHVDLTLPVWLFFILGIILVWVSINVTNCTDGVDGLSASLCMVTLGSIYCAAKILGVEGDSWFLIILFVVCLLAYLWFNATPSLLLMGDAGSRAMGLFISIMILKTKSPVLYLLLATVLIADGGIGLVKVSLKRFLKICILKNTTTPLHDHVRKNKGWSNTQVVFRFVIIQIMISAITLYLIQL